MTAILLGSVAALTTFVACDAAGARRVPGRSTATAPPLDLSRLLVTGGRALDHLWPARRHRRRDAQLPDALERLSSSIRAGLSLAAALGEVADRLPDPLGGELRRTRAAVRHGAPLSEALAAWAAPPEATPAVRLVAAALTLAADGGGEVARAVDRVAATLRERRELEGEVRALATQASASALVLAVAPVVFALLVASVEPGAVTFLLTTPVGLGCLAGGLLLEGLGARWMVRITRAAR